MGREYAIMAEPYDKDGWNRFLGGLDNPVDASGWVAFTANAADRGIYFCDHGWSLAAAVAFKRIVDHALSGCAASIGGE